MTELRTSEVLNRAADLIEKRGWTKGQGWPGVGETEAEGSNLCLEGGIMAAMGHEGMSGLGQTLTECPAYFAVREYLDWRRERLGQSYLFQWNDRDERTASEVIETLRAAALIESSREQMQDDAYATYAENLAVAS